MTGNDASSFLFVFLGRAARRLDDALQAKLRERGMFTTNHVQSLVLGNLSLGEVRISRLADKVGISPQGVTKILVTPSEEGLVTAVTDGADKRARLVQLTPRGEAYLDIVRSIYIEMERELESRFTRPVMELVRMVMEDDWRRPAPGGTMPRA